MSQDTTELLRLIGEMATLIEQNDEPDPQFYALFFQHPEYSFQLVDLINSLDEDHINDDPPIYSACIFALDICVAQLQAATEGKNKVTTKILTQLMNHLAAVINVGPHSLSFWLPILNAFYEVHVELSEDLKAAYFDLANQEEDTQDEGDPLSHLDAIRDLIHELSDLSVFDITENFFAQSYAMPPDFYADLVVDLYNIKEGQDIALLGLLHPKPEVRELVVSTLDQLMDQVVLTSISLSRLEAIKHWYGEAYFPMFNRWIKTQRKKGVVFEPEPIPATLFIKATEVDGTGSQGIFIHVRKKRKNRLCGLLLKYDIGIKDAWLTPYISSVEVGEYYQQAFEESVTLREVDVDYLKMMVEHFLAVTIEQGNIPHLHFLEIQELLGLRLKPHKLDIESLIEQLSVQIAPFTQEVITESLKRSKTWLKSKQFTESWYLENTVVDKIVNHNSSYLDGVKVCQLEGAMEEVFEQEMETNRQKWQFHFLWIALWVKAKTKKNEKIGTDSFLIAYTIHEGIPLKEIPVMKEICYQTVINSIETMQERKTHLNQE
ncbi:MAG: hypothetical protein ACHP6H_01490 [Legionellales bacterium]